MSKVKETIDEAEGVLIVGGIVAVGGIALWLLNTATGARKNQNYGTGDKLTDARHGLEEGLLMTAIPGYGIFKFIYEKSTGKEFLAEDAITGKQEYQSNRVKFENECVLNGGTYVEVGETSYCVRSPVRTDTIDLKTGDLSTYRIMPPSVAIKLGSPIRTANDMIGRYVEMSKFKQLCEEKGGVVIGPGPVYCIKLGLTRDNNGIVRKVN